MANNQPLSPQGYNITQDPTNFNPFWDQANGSGIGEVTAEAEGVTYGDPAAASVTKTPDPETGLDNLDFHFSIPAGEPGSAGRGIGTVSAEAEAVAAGEPPDASVRSETDPETGNLNLTFHFDIPPGEQGPAGPGAELPDGSQGDLLIANSEGVWEAHDPADISPGGAIGDLLVQTGSRGVQWLSEEDAIPRIYADVANIGVRVYTIIIDNYDIGVQIPDDIANQITAGTVFLFSAGTRNNIITGVIRDMPTTGTTEMFGMTWDLSFNYPAKSNMIYNVTSHILSVLWFRMLPVSLSQTVTIDGTTYPVTSNVTNVYTDKLSQGIRPSGKCALTIIIPTR